MRRLPRSSVFLLAWAACLGGSPAQAATLEMGVDYGNPGGSVMNLYVPDDVSSSPAIVVTLTFCNGSAADAAAWFRASADRLGFIVIAPGLPPGDGDGCWDVGSQATLTHDGGSHSQDIVAMVHHVIEIQGADPSRVFVAGASAGAMMANVLLGSYPDVFAAGSVLAGVPFGCWTVPDGWSTACASGQIDKSPEEWGALVRDAYPGYEGPRPRVQLFHGTADTALSFPNLAETVEQWTNVLAPLTELAPQANTPKSGWTLTEYEDESGEVMLEVQVGQNVPHDISGTNPWGEVIRFFGVDREPEPSTGGSSGASGGAASGGAPASSGGSGGASSGGASGGTNAEASGGQPPTSGGAPSTGGQWLTSGGAPSTGGIVAAPSGGGTMPASGGQPSAGGGGDAEPTGSPGCSLSASSHPLPSPAGLLWLALPGLTWLLRRRHT